MASITIRQHDDDLKRRLRLRAARNGRSMEDEARTILRDAASLEDGKIEARADAHRRDATRGRVVADTPARAAAGDRAAAGVAGVFAGYGVVIALIALQS